MKKMNRVVSLLIAVTLCLSQAWAERISQDDAALVANNFMNVASQNSAVKKAVPAKRMVLKTAAAQEENQYYVYENADGEGWVIVAANDAVMPILAYSETGHFRTDNMPVNIRKWMGKYNNFIKKIEDDGVQAGEETKEEWTALKKGVRKAAAAVVVGPLVKTTWDQDDPYYNLCPGSGTSKAYTGCVATAMAQVMNYWQWPVKGTGSHSYSPKNPNTGKSQTKYGTQSVNFGETTYDWNNMLNSYTSSATAAQKTAVATLMYHCGVATEMMYGDDAWGGSGTYTVNYGDDTWGTTDSNQGGCAQNALWYYFGYKKSTIKGYMREGYTEGGYKYYDSWTDAAWTAMVKEELDKLHPIMYAGTGDEGGHSFICDGYRDDNYFHFNWGWSGQNDGYFLLSNLNPGSGGAGGGSYNFSEDQDVIIGIVPDRQDLPKVIVTWSVNGVTSTTEFTQEDPLVLPATPANCTEGKVFVGWTKNSTVSGDKPSDLFTSATGKTVSEAVTYYAVFATLAGEGGAAVADELTHTTIGVKGNNYADWSGKTVKSDAVYAGNSAGGNSAIQLRAKNNNSGIVTTTSGGKISKVSVEWNSNTADGRQLDVYGSNKAYSSASDLYGNNAGTKLGTITYGASAEVEVSGSYAYVGVRSNSNALYLDAITFTWGGGATYTDYSLSCGAQGVEYVKSDAAKSKKMIVNGQLIIVHGDKLYNATGARIQ